MAPIDNAWTTVVPRFVAMLLVASAAAVAESPHVEPRRAARWRELTLCLLIGSAVAGVAVGSLGVNASRERRTGASQLAMCAETVNVPLVCAAEHDLRER